MVIIDELALQRNKPYCTDKGLYIKQPTLDDIIDVGYTKYEDYLYSLISTPRDIADILWCKMKIWYEDLKSDWDFFLQNALVDSRGINLKVDDDIIQAIAISESQRDAFNFFLNKSGEYIIMDKKQPDELEPSVVMVSAKYTDDTHETCYIDEDSCKISEEVYNDIVFFLKKANWATFDYEFTKGGTKKAKKYILEHDYKASIKHKKSNITLSSIVSSLIAKGQSYDDIWGFPIYMIYDLYYRYIKIDDWDNTMHALHSGCIDTQKNPINWDKINWSSIIK